MSSVGPFRPLGYVLFFILILFLFCPSQPLLPRAHGQEVEEEVFLPPDSEGAGSVIAEAPSAPSPTPFDPSDSAGSETDSKDKRSPSVSFRVDEFTAAAHLNYPIVVPPARGGLAPNLSLHYKSVAGNSWIAQGWDLSAGFVQRKGWRRGVPRYDDTDVFVLQVGTGPPQELVPLGNGQYRLKIEGQFLRIKYSSFGNTWEVWNKSGVRMTFGSALNSRTGRVREPNSFGETFRWCLDGIEDPNGNYMELLYWRDQDQGATYQVYLQEVRYNGNRRTGFVPNHRVLFHLEPFDRPDPVSSYRGGFLSLTRKRLSSIEVRTDGGLVRRYELRYTVSNVRSLLSFVTLYGSDNQTALPSTRFFYQAFQVNLETALWENPALIVRTVGEENRDYEAYWKFPRESTTRGQSDLVDLNGDGLPDWVVAPVHATYS